MENKCDTECMECMEICMECCNSCNSCKYVRRPRQLQHLLANNIQGYQAYIVLHVLCGSSDTDHASYMNR